MVDRLRMLCAERWIEGYHLRTRNGEEAMDSVLRISERLAGDIDELGAHGVRGIDAVRLYPGFVLQFSWTEPGRGAPASMAGEVHESRWFCELMRGGEIIAEGDGSHPTRAFKQALGDLAMEEGYVEVKKKRVGKVHAV